MNTEHARAAVDARRFTVTAANGSARQSAMTVASGEAIPHQLRELVRLANSADALRSEVMLFRTLDQSLPELIFMTDADGVPMYQNAAWRRYVGISSDDMKHERWESLCADEDVAVVHAAWKDALESGQPFTVEARLRRQDGVYRWFSCQAVQVQNERGQATNWVMACTDIHSAYLDREQQSQLQLENLRKDEFLATLAHEMRSPLAPIRHALDVLKQADCDVHVQATARGIMERQVDVLVRLVQGLMDVSRSNLGKLELRRERVDLQSVLDRVVESTQGAVSRARHQLQLDLPPDPIVLDADPLRLYQILVNLVSNAVKYTDAGGVVRVAAREVNDVVEVRITDNGMGIAREELERIFDLFSQGSRPNMHIGDGVGIGLALVRQLVTAHGGDVRAISDGVGMGSTFVVRLPRPS